jgi:hypothetical protein
MASSYTPWQVVYALHACSFAAQLRLMHLANAPIGSVYRLVEAQNNGASIRKPLAIEYIFVHLV